MYTAQKFLSSIKTYTTCLGQGAFGIVLKGLDDSDTPSAVKFLFPVDYSDRDKLRREFKLTQDLQHENIVQIMEVEETKLTLDDIDKIFKDLPSNEKLAMVNFRCREKANSSYSKSIESICIKMELCGSNLRNWLNEKHQKNDLHVQIRQTRIVQGMITGLQFLHNNKIIHRDLKPENIMFSRKDQLPVKIGDFGHSRLIHSEETQTGSLTSGVGTRSYMAPEVSSGEYDYQADLYSLGLIIWEVAQLIEASKRINLFDTLVNDRKEALVQDHPIMVGIKEIIIKLTKRYTVDRTTSLDRVNIESWEAALVHQVTRKGRKPLWDVITSQSEKNWSVETSEEFKLALDYAGEGCTINLADGEYSGGRFILWENGVKIVGKGTGTVLRGVDPSRRIDFLVVFGSECTISEVKIILDHTSSSSIVSGIVLKGDMNTIKNVEINSSGRYRGIEINGSHNTVDHVFMNNLFWGISIEPNSNSNTISNITGVELGGGIWVRGSNNTLSQINLENRIRSSGGDGMRLALGSSNTISNLTCSGYFSEGATYDLSIYSPNTTVKDSQCGSVWVWGKDATLTNVDCGELIRIDSDVEGVNLINCRGKMLEASDNVEVIDCHFQSR